MVRARSGVPLKRGRKRTRKLTKGFRQSRHNLYRSEEHTSELQSQSNIVCRLLLEKKKFPRRRASTQPSLGGHFRPPSSIYKPTAIRAVADILDRRRLHATPPHDATSSCPPTARTR